MNLVIKRSQWLRGEGPKHSKLIRSSDNKMCCLGFFGLACKVPPSMMIDISSPEDIKEGNDVSKEQWTAESNEGAYLFDNTNDMSYVCYDLMTDNDDPALRDEHRENNIKNHFASIGVAVEFID